MFDLVAFRPFRSYAALREGSSRVGGGAPIIAPTVLGGTARLLFVIGAFVAYTAAGRLDPRDVASGAASFSYVPLVQTIALALALRAVAPGQSLRRALALYLAGHGPWLLLFCGVTGACIFARTPGMTLRTIGLPVLVATWAWGMVVTVAFFRAGLGLTRARTAIATAILQAVTLACVLGYFLVAGQLLPILPW